MFKKKKSKKSELKQKVIDSNILDKTFYIDAYMDVLLSNLTILDHFLSIGLKENRNPNSNFDAQWYITHYQDVKKYNLSAVEHFLLAGEAENRFVNSEEQATYKVISESGLFDEEYYLRTYPDLAAYKEAGRDMLLHFIRFGAAENRKPNHEFNTIWYRQHYTDISKDSLNPLIHYILYGQHEGRFPNEDLYEINLALQIETALEEKQREKEQLERAEKEKEELEARKELLKDNIRELGLFDDGYYFQTYLESQENTIDPLTHFVEYGLKENYKPNASFDPVWYKEYYTDIKDSYYPFEHFVKYGKVENRFVNSEEQATYKVISESGLFDEEYYLRTYPDLAAYKEAGRDMLLHFIRFGAAENRKPNHEFNTIWYKEYYPDVLESKKNPLLHYIESGIQEGHFPSEIILMQKQQEAKYPEKVEDFDILEQHEKDEYMEISSFAIDWSRYFEVNSHPLLSNDPIIDYIKNWRKFEPLVPGSFDTEFYLQTYPDIKECGMNPFIHYFAHGKKEGRQGILDPKCIEKGKLHFDLKKETIVFVSHESSATGAPLLGYAIADKLSEKYNIVHIVLKKANIHDAFLNNCDLILQDVQHSAYTSSYFFLKQLMQTRSIKCVVINSIVGYQTMYAAYKLHLPIVFLIHEFAEYMRPFGTMINAVLHSDYVITPAKIIQDSILKEFNRFTNYKEIPANMCIYPQGKLPYIPDTYGDDDSVETLYKKLKIDNPDDTKIIVGSGWVQIRKGIDLFIAVARYIKKLYSGKCKFVWVGEGFDPDNDLAYSVYLEREIVFSGLGDDFVFLEHQKNLDTIFSIADVFCLGSRMDPFPNVVIDALGHDLHVACFDHGSGSAEFLRKHHANATIVDFVDTYEMAKSISSYLQNGNDKQGVNQEILKEYLDFDKYVAYIDQLVNKAVEFKTHTNEIIEKLLESDLFDADYYGGTGDAREKCRKYVEYGLKGIHYYNPKIGFSEIDWIEKHSKNNKAIVPLYEAMVSKQIEMHKVVCLPSNTLEVHNCAYAVHLHLYYIDMASYFASYFKNLPHGYDLYITIVTAEAKEEVEEKFSECGALSVKVICVENIGRDIAPLLFELKDDVLSGKYDVVGHFHSKKSLDLEAGGGDKWLEYLMQHLIGDTDNAQDVLSVFNNPSVGLVFPEDTNTSDIGENREFVAFLCEILKLSTIEQTPIFPMGNMFWARIEALKELFYLDKNVVLQPEPLPYDGSYMHAIERITPYLVEKNGYEYVTVYKEGMAWK